MKNLVASAGSKEGLERLINEFYYSNGYYIDENMAIQHSGNKAYSGQGRVILSVKEEEMTYEEVKEYFEYSTWEREPAYGGTCFTSPDKVLYVFFIEEEKAINVAFYGPESHYHMVVEIDPRDCKYRNSGNFYMGPITVVAPRNPEKIEEDF